MEHTQKGRNKYHQIERCIDILLNEKKKKVTPEGHISRSVYAIFKVVNVADTAADFLKGLLPGLGLAI